MSPSAAGGGEGEDNAPRPRAVDRPAPVGWRTEECMGGALKSRAFDERYYLEHKAAGLDYLGHGYWHNSYAAMVTDATLQYTYDAPFFFDAGCACGSILQGFKDTNIFHHLLGIDLSEYMVSLGRSHFRFAPDEIKTGSIEDTNLPDESVTLLHSAQVLEHIVPEKGQSIIREFARILKQGGRAFLALDAVRHGETKEQYMGDPTHLNIKPVSYWTRLLQDHGLYFDVEAYNRFVRSPRGPTEGDPRSFYQAYPAWSVWALIKGG
jgi:SAM-dependent methyltransferase